MRDMGKRYKFVNIALIFMLIGVVVCQEAYCLRVPIQTDYDQIIKKMAGEDKSSKNSTAKLIFTGTISKKDLPLAMNIIVIRKGDRIVVEGQDSAFSSFLEILEFDKPEFNKFVVEIIERYQKEDRSDCYGYSKLAEAEIFDRGISVYLSENLPYLFANLGNSILIDISLKDVKDIRNRRVLFAAGMGELLRKQQEEMVIEDDIIQETKDVTIELLDWNSEKLALYFAGVTDILQPDAAYLKEIIEVLIRDNLEEEQACTSFKALNAISKKARLINEQSQPDHIRQIEEIIKSLEVNMAYSIFKDVKNSLLEKREYKYVEDLINDITAVLIDNDSEPEWIELIEKWSSDIELALQKSFENHPRHYGPILEILQTAAYCDRQVLNVVMHRIMEHFDNLGPSGKECLEYLPNTIDAKFGNNWILHTRVVSALHRISLFRRDSKKLKALIAGKANPNEITEEEIDAIDPANFSRDCPEYFIIKRMLFMLGYRFDSKDRKWKRSGGEVEGKFLEEPRRSLVDSTGHPETKIDRIDEIRVLNDKKELMRILTDSRGYFFNRSAAARRMAELKTVELKDFRHVVEYYPYRYDIVSKALTFFALGQKGRYESALREDIIDLIKNLLKRKEDPLLNMAAQNALRILGEIHEADFQPIRFGAAVRLFEQIPAVNTVIFEDLFGREYFLLCEPPTASQLRSLPDLEFEVPVFCDYEDRWFITRGTEYNAVTSSVLVGLIEEGRLKVFVHSHLEGEAEPTERDFEHLNSPYAFIVSIPGIVRYFIEPDGTRVSRFTSWGDVPEDFLSPAKIAVEILADLDEKRKSSTRTKTGM